MVLTVAISNSMPRERGEFVAVESRTFTWSLLAACRRLLENLACYRVALVRGPLSAGRLLRFDVNLRKVSASPLLYVISTHLL